MKRVCLALVLLLGSSTALRAQTTPTPGTVQHVICDSGCGGGLGGGSTADQGAAAATTDAAAWPIKVVFGSTQIDPRDVSDRAARLLGKVTFDGAQHVIVDTAPTTAVTGTFWQATQPVSGTFWQATQPVSGTFWQSTQPVSLASLPSLAAGSAVIGHIICDSGCGGAASFLDNGAFTFGTTSINLMGAVVDDVATNAAAENSAAAPRMSTNRVLFVDLKNTQANTTAIKVDGTGGTFPVTGTFWQGTQPVSIATLPALTTGSAVIGHVIADTGSTTAVTGTVSDNLAQVAGTTTSVNSGVKDAGTLRVILATDQPQLTNKLLVTPDALPANQSVNVNQLAGTTTSVSSGVKDAGTLRVVLATDQPALTNKLLVTPDSVALPANQTVNLNQLAGTATAVNSGTLTAGTLRVVLATDQPALTNKLLVTPDSVALPANQSVNVNQIGGSSVSTAATGVQKVGVTGNAGAAVDAANNAAMPANAIATGLQTATIDTSPTAASAGNLRYQLASTEGVTYVQEGGPKRFSCVVPSSTTAITQCQAAPAAGLRAYVTSVTMSNAAATVQTLDVVYGTVTNCGTGTTALTHKVQFGTNATTTSPQSYEMAFPTPLVPAAATAICVRPANATAFGATITGYIAP